MNAALAGVDGCPAGWIVVTRDDAGALHAAVVPDAEALAAHTDRCAAVAIDIPIGLPDAERRACDVAARALLRGGRASSVFPCPVRATLDARDHADALARSRAASGRGLSVQAFHLLPKIRDVDAALRARPAWAARVHEVHPEVSFALWNGGRALAASKRTAAGRAERRALVERHFGAVTDALRAAVPRRAAADDDLLDACAALWTAERIVAGRARRLPDPPEHDRHGLPMTITA